MNQILRKTEEEIYNEIKEIDFVISNDPILTDTLNKYFLKDKKEARVFTPKQILSKINPNLFDTKQEILNELKKNIDINYKQLDRIYYDYIEKKIEGTSKIEKNWEDRFDEIKSIYSANKNEISKFLDEIEKIYKKNIAIIDIEMFNEFDKTFVRSYYKEIKIFKEGHYRIENSYLFENEYQLIDYLVNTIEKNKEKNNDIEKEIAIFIGDYSVYKSVLKYKFKKENIKIKDEKYDPRKNQISILQEMMKTILFIDNLKIKENIQILEYLKIKYLNKDINVYLREFKTEELKKYYNDVNELKDKKIIDILKFLKLEKSQLKNILEEASMLFKEINYKNYNELKYYFKKIYEYNTPFDQGILFLSSESKITTINRPIVFFIGLNNNVDIEYQNFLRITQSSKDKYFLFSREEKNLQVFPNVNFSNINSNIKKIEDTKEIKKFEDFENINLIKYVIDKNKNLNKDLNKNLKENYEMENITQNINLKNDNQIIDNQKTNNKETNNQKINNQKTEELQNKLKLSASKISSYKKCPKMFFFSNIITQPQTYESLRGSYLHNFAECYLNNKNLVLNKKQKIIDFIVNDLKKFENKNIEIIKGEIKYYIDIVINFLDNIEIIDFSKEKTLENKINIIKTDKKKRNTIATIFDIDLKLINTEFFFRIENLSGFFDLLINKDIIIDYKTKSIPQSIAESIHPIKMQKDCDYQPLVYLYYLKNYSKNPEFKYLYLKTKISEKMHKLDKNIELINVKYIDEYYIDYINENENIIKYYYSKIGDIEMESQEFNTKLKKILNEYQDEEMRKINKENKTLFLMDLDLFYNIIKKEFPLRTKEIFDFIKSTRIESKPNVFFFKDDMLFFKKEKEKISKEIIENTKTFFPANPINKKVCENCPYRLYCSGFYDD
ncbi:MAG: PD-(D/E)XK nuclease family protein [Candidatus Nanoarchaeia archaeon]|nr:PD-(D/E)XK nuclease family protein [Candidatus Nanoarchaeia archaeon]